VAFDDAALAALAATNHGDLRALVRDLQVMTSDLNGAPLTADVVRTHADAGGRDVSVEIFPGLDGLYKSRNSEEAVTITRTIDKDPNEFLNWVHWNNPALFEDKPSVRRGTQALAQADRMMMGRYLNTAHRSTYWTHHLAALAASVANTKPLKGKLWPSYPAFLRRGGTSVQPSVLSKLSLLSGTSKATTRDELLPALKLMLHEKTELGMPENFNISLALGLDASEHVALCGLAKSRRSTKELMSSYEQAQETLVEERLKQEAKHVAWETTSADMEVIREQQATPADEDPEAGPDPGQMTLF